MNDVVILGREQWAEFSAELTKLRLRVAELEGALSNEESHSSFWQARAEAAEAKLEAVRGLQRYRVEPLNPEYYDRGAASFTKDPNGNAVLYSELQALLNQEQTK